MEKKGWREELLERLRDCLDSEMDCIEIELNENDGNVEVVMKNDATGVSIQCVNIHEDSMLALFSVGKLDMIIDNIRDTVCSVAELLLLTKENILERVVPILRNPENEPVERSKRPKRSFFNLNLCYMITREIDKDKMINIHVNDSMCEKFNITEEELYESSMKNLREKETVIAQSLLSALKIAMGQEEETELIPGMMIFRKNDDDGIPAYSVSTGKRYNGATAIFYPGILKRISEELNSDLVLVPSSVHEFIVIPEIDENQVDDINEMLNEINMAVVSEDDYLSDSVYRYDKDTGVISMREDDETYLDEWIL